MKIFAFEEITYPGLPANLGPEVRITNRYCSPQLWGDVDQLTPLAHAHIFSSHMRRSRVTVIENAGHFPQKEKPQTFLQVVCNFLQGRDEPVEGTR